MGYGLLRALPGETGLACHRLRKTLKHPATRHLPLGRQDHTTSPSASCTLVSCAIGVHRISTRVRDDREAPLDRVRRADRTLSCTSDKAKYFTRGDLTRFHSIASSGNSAAGGQSIPSSFRGAPPGASPESIHPQNLRPNGFRVLAYGEPRNDEGGICFVGCRRQISHVIVGGLRAPYRLPKTVAGGKCRTC